MAEAPDEATTVAYFNELIARDAAGERTQILIGPWAAMTLIIMLQLSLRHPDIPNSIKNGTLYTLGQLEPLFKGTYGEMLITAGYDTSQDVEAG